MSAHNKVLWSEGLFLRPQHFQQQDRYVERYVESRCQAIVPHGWGFSELELEPDLLGIGKLAIRRAVGVCPDGTPFRIPEDDPLPAPLEIEGDARGQIVYLAVPLRRGDAPDVALPADADGLARYAARRVEVRDTATGSGEPAVLDVGGLRYRLLLASERTEAFACVPLAQVLEVRTDKRVVLDESFIPTVLRTRTAPRLAGFVTELVGKIHQRGERLAGRAVATARGSAAQIEEYLTLQVLNRYEPVLAHFNESGAQHPEELYRVLVALAGELATYWLPARRPPGLGVYRHDQLRESFDLVRRTLDAEFSAVIEEHATRIPLEERGFNISVGVVADRSLYANAVFVLAAKADMPAEELRRRFPAQTKVGPVERIRDLVNLALPGVPLYAVPVAPRAIPFHAGFAYFELDQSNELWTQLQTSGGLAIFPGGEFPGLAMECWAIRA